MERIDAIVGSILGCAAGDALGLPYEGLSKPRGVRLLGAPSRYRFFFGRGMVSDDTEHTCMVAQALCESPSNVDVFARKLAKRFRWWLLGAPAGIGSATLRSIAKLWLGFSPKHSGVFSAGNGPAMRSAILGAAIDDIDLLHNYVRASTIITHTDSKAFEGAFAVALAAWCAKRSMSRSAEFFGKYREIVNASSVEFNELISKVENSLAMGETTELFAAGIGCALGVSGYVFRTVPVVLHAWLSHPNDYRQAVDTVIRCGGDTDTTAAIVGAIVGSGVGRVGIPPEWLLGLWEWPKSVKWMSGLGKELERAIHSGSSIKLSGVFPGLGLIRNAIFTGTVFVHIGRRLLPPY